MGASGYTTISVRNKTGESITFIAMIESKKQRRTVSKAEMVELWVQRWLLENKELIESLD